MRYLVIGFAAVLAGCAISNTASRPTGAPGLATSGAGIQPGASAGASIGGGPLGSGTDDDRAGAR
jgi:hypothetical protein